MVHLSRDSGTSNAMEVSAQTAWLHKPSLLAKAQWAASFQYEKGTPGNFPKACRPQDSDSFLQLNPTRIHIYDDLLPDRLGKSSQYCQRVTNICKKPACKIPQHYKALITISGLHQQPQNRLPVHVLVVSVQPQLPF